MDPDPPENALKLKEGIFSTTLLIIGFRIHRKNYIKTERRTRNTIFIIKQIQKTGMKNIGEKGIL